MDEFQNQIVLLPDNDPEVELRRTGARRTLVLAGLIAGVLALSSGSPELLPRLCIWYHLTGSDCPFCGLTRSVVAAGDIQLRQAFELHPFGPMVLVFLAAWLVVSIQRWRTGKPGVMPRKLQRIFLFGIGIAWLAWWVVEKLL